MRVFKLLTIALMLTGCHQYKCIQGKAYHRIDGAWIESNLYKGQLCAEEVENEPQ